MAILGEVSRRLWGGVGTLKKKCNTQLGKRNGRLSASDE
ncbi:Hypothetical protein CpMEX30_1692 [Corynebacterium pseudotuberculosis]|nr:Hypothetical protein CpE19_1622 [Corynebacterium pseudotuberculosis]APQ54705.1 Hypothetical protein CpMEX30_1692 [Corynebacterium pseudotuberculosis]APQ56782.1 Hypothetical protein CpMEX31_1680 [Corynebacterium pseudotuberculosis]ARX64288.1 Hypothetical protein Cp262_2183 [Corynebacterium pseudotuberculosis]ATB62582.1 Hypothetical protein BFF96_1708 [Corynebacterium pseudotuberculosis]